eukprot:Lithocolla_globosa_v1_NODE_3630_length_1620_cov_25.512460.p4 type:complete len:111 gc:universal NODE_3630_length_1620_cov_25.512460:159-491(+)
MTSTPPSSSTRSAYMLGCPEEEAILPPVFKMFSIVSKHMLTMAGSLHSSKFRTGFRHFAWTRYEMCDKEPPLVTLLMTQAASFFDLNSAVSKMWMTPGTMPALITRSIWD